MTDRRIKITLSGLSPEESRRLALPAIDAALEGIPGPTALRLCLGYDYVARDKPSSSSFQSETSAARIRAALAHIRRNG